MTKAGASPSAPRVDVLLFAVLREQAGWSRRSVTIEAGEPFTPARLWSRLGIAGDTIPARVRVAVNHRFSDAHAVLQDGDEVAFLPPISGG